MCGSPYGSIGDREMLLSQVGVKVPRQAFIFWPENVHRWGELKKFMKDLDKECCCSGLYW